MTDTAATAVPRAVPVPHGVRWGLAHDTPLPRERGNRLVAVASSGGVTVDTAFEEAEAFHLYDLSAGKTRYIGRQACPLPVSGATSEDVVRLLCDCDLVVCAGIGGHCRGLLERLGVGCQLECVGQRLEHAITSASRLDGHG
jgi:predicted Fe-Mo cluster-binding NifX family protein